MLEAFGVSLSMIKIVGGIVLMRIGFQLFAPSSRIGMIPTGGSKQADGMDVAFSPVAMPIMFGPGGIATLISMAATMHVSLAWNAQQLVPIAATCLAIIATMLTVYLSLVYSERILDRIGPSGTRRRDPHHRFFRGRHGHGPDPQRARGIPAALWIGCSLTRRDGAKHVRAVSRHRIQAYRASITSTGIPSLSSCGFTLAASPTTTHTNPFGSIVVRAAWSRLAGV